LEISFSFIICFVHILGIGALGFVILEKNQDMHSLDEILEFDGQE